jgi:hypothetical protein
MGETLVPLPSGKPRWHQRVKIALLVSILLLEITVLITVLPDFLAEYQSRRALAALPEVQQDAYRREMMRNDPPLGTQVPWPEGPNLNAGNSSSFTPTKTRVLVFVGSCSSCSGNVIDAWQKAQDLHSMLTIAIVSQDKPDNILRFLKTSHYHPFFSDADLRCSKSFNATCTPRAYAVDSHLRLIWLQGAEVDDPLHLADHIAQVQR